jgi:polyhydroxybutyrate depolymerase
MHGEEAKLSILGGGHTWPSGLLYLPRFLIGPVCRDFDAPETIWQFFAEYPKE